MVVHNGKRGGREGFYQRNRSTDPELGETARISGVLGGYCSGVH
jgi:hypothetical protein